MSGSKGMTVARQGLFLLGAGALTLGLQWIAALLGAFGFFANLLVPLPAAYAQMRCGLPVGIGVVALTTSILVGGGNSGGAIAYLVQFGVASVVLPFLLRRRWPWDRAVAGSLAVAVMVAALTFGGYAASRGATVGELAEGYVQGEVDSALSIYRQADLPEDQRAELTAMAQRMGDLLLRAWPALAVAATGAILLLTVLLLKALACGHYEVPGLPFRFWAAPEPLIWPLILAGFGMVFAEGPLQTVALNFLVILIPVYFLQGLAIISFYFERKAVPPFVRGFGYLLATILNPLPLIVTGMGVFDLWADFRKPRIKKKS